MPKQRAYVYRNGILIGVSTCSTGKKGFETPTGVFTILEKAKEHASSEFDDAPMPHMERLTWGGVALHAGKLPGYPASHGCVRLPPKFAENLFEVTQIGTPVIIAGDVTDPASVKDPGPVLGSSAKAEIDAKVGKKAAGGVRSWPRAMPTSKMHRSRSAPTSSSGKAATRTDRLGTEWVSMPTARRGRAEHRRARADRRLG